MTAARSTPGRQHVEVLTTRPGGRFVYGSGYLLASRLVLTADHVVRGGGQIQVRLGLDPDGPTIAGTRLWSGSGDVDLALIRLDDVVPGTVERPSFGELNPRPDTDGHGRSWKFRCTGFPALQTGTSASGRPFRDSLTLRGTANLDWNLKSGSITLGATEMHGSSAEDWQGMSGAPVFVHQWLVGVLVVAARGSATLRALPISSVLGGRPVRLGSFNATPRSRRGFAQIIRQHAIPHRLTPAHRQPYRDTLRLVRDLCPELKDRSAELARLRKWIRSDKLYAVRRGLPWSGKTSLAASLADADAPTTDFVTYFVSRARGQNDAVSLIASLADQLAALLDEPTPGRAEAEFAGLLARAAVAAQAQGRPLVVVIDGLDEIDDREGIRSVLAHLPRVPTPWLSILLLARPSLTIEEFVEPSHPVTIDAECDRVDLVPSKHSAELSHRALQEVEALLDGPATIRRAVRCIAHVGPMSIDELAELLGSGDAESDILFKTFRTAATRRTFVALPPHRRARYAFAHDTLREVVVQKSLTSADTQYYEDRMAELGTRYADLGWPERTPDVLLGDYLAYLAQVGDLARLAATATSPRWVGALRRRFGVAVDPADQARRALRSACDRDGNDLSVLLTVGLELGEPAADVWSCPRDLIHALAMVGRYGTAFALAQRAEDPKERVDAAADVAEVLLSTAHPGASDAVARAAAAALSPELTTRHRPDGATAPEPPSAAWRMGSMGRLALMAHHTRQVGLAAELNDRIWETAAELNVEPSTEQLLLAAADFATRLGDHQHPRVVVDKLDGIAPGTAAAEQLDALRARLDSAAAPDMPALAPSSITTTAPDFEQFTRDRGANGWHLHRVEIALARGDLADAAALVREFSPAVESLFDMVGGHAHPVAALALAAARRYGSDALDLVDAADEFVIDDARRMGAVTWQASTGGLHQLASNGLLPDQAGHFLVECVSEAAMAGHLDDVLRCVPTTGSRQAVDLVTACVAVGAARSGHTVTALRLLDLVRSDEAVGYTIDQLAMLWAKTSRWRDAVALLGGRGTAETHVVRCRAVATAIGRGEIRAGIALATSAPGNLFITPAPVVAARALAERGQIASAFALLGEHADASQRVELQLTAALACRRFGDLDECRWLLWAAVQLAKSVPVADRVPLLLRAGATFTDIDEPLFSAVARRAAISAAFRIKQTSARLRMFLAIAEADELASATSRVGLTRTAVDQAVSVGNDASLDARTVDQIVSQAVVTFLAMGEHDDAERAVDVLLPRGPSVTDVADAVTALAARGRSDRARALLGSATGRIRDQGIQGLRSNGVASHYSASARVAMSAGLTADAVAFAAQVPPDDRSDLLAELAIMADEGGDRQGARRFVLEGLVTGVTPRLLASAARIDPAMAPQVVEWFVQESIRPLSHFKNDFSKLRDVIGHTTM